VPGVRRGKVVILGGGTVGTNSAKLASGMGADTVVLDVSNNRLAYLDDIFGSRITPVYSDPAQIARYVREADLVIGGVLIPGAKAPKLASEKLVSEMQEGSVVVDVAVDPARGVGVLDFERADGRRREFEGPSLAHHGALYSGGLRLTKNERDAEDLVQDTFLRAFSFFDRFERGTQMKAWLFEILTNT